MDNGNNMGWTVIRYARSETEAGIIKGLMESAGIPAIIRQEAIGKVYRLTVNGLGEIKILVPEIHREEAEKILASR